MKNLQNHIFSTTTCISKETMLKFINKQLSQKELHEVQTHLLDCEFCTEALQGMAYAKNPSVLFTIDHQIDQRTQQKSHSITRILMVAASVLLFVFGGYYTINNFNETAKTNDNEISFQEPVTNKIETLVPAQEEVEAEQKEVLPNRITVVENDKYEALAESSDADYRFAEESPIEDLEGDRAENQKQLKQQTDQKVTTTATTSGNVYKKELREDNLSVKDSENDVLFFTKVVTEKETSKADKNLEQTVAKQVASKANADDSKKLAPNKNRAKKSAESPSPSSVSLADEFKSRDATVKLEETEEVVNTRNESYTQSEASGGVTTGSTSATFSNLTNGITAYNAKKYSNAIQHFNLVVSNNESMKNRTEANWYKVLCLIELNDKITAKKLLEDLTHYNNEYSLKAENKLKELE